MHNEFNSANLLWNISLHYQHSSWVSVVIFLSHSLLSRAAWQRNGGSHKAALAGTSKDETKQHCHPLLTQGTADEVMQLVEDTRALDWLEAGLEKQIIVFLSVVNLSVSLLIKCLFWLPLKILKCVESSFSLIYQTNLSAYFCSFLYMDTLEAVAQV